MTPQEIINSGLLELYVLGQLEGEELSMIESAIKSHDAVKNELREIEETMSKYATIHSIPADDNILSRALEQINSSAQIEGQSASSIDPKSAAPVKSIWSWLGPVSAIAAAIAMVIAFIQFDKFNQLTDRMETVIADCEETESKLQEQETLYAALMDEDSRPVLIDPTEKYPETRLIIHHNEVDRVNYLQISNLPTLSDGLAFQLWSLKGTDSPIPLSVFIEDGEIIIPIDFELGTDAYAITIEPSGGSQTPNLDELIGVFAMG